ncbi:MAG: helix-turn-helix domain-containing protein [Kofleriaceae bacterium]
MRRKPAATYHHGDLGRALVEAALATIDRAGVDALTLRELARQLGVSPGAPYRHFADKDALLAAVAADVTQRYQAEVAQAAAEAPPDALAQFRATGIAAVRFAVRSPAHFRVMCTQATHAIDPATADNHATLAAAQADGQLAPLPLDAILLAARCAIYGLSRLIVDDQLPGGPVTLAQADAMALAITDVLGHGLVPRLPGDPCTAPSAAPTDPAPGSARRGRPSR